MLYRKIIAVCSQIHTKYTNTLCRRDVEVVNVKPGGKYSNHYAPTDKISKVIVPKLVKEMRRYEVHLLYCFTHTAYLNAE